MLWTSLFKSKRAIFATTGLLQNKANLAFLLELVKKGAINAVIDRRYLLERLPDAHMYVETARKRGNVIIKI
ncbi:zinc-binding dehydrogenase [Paenibacillus methanolicus]|uniref:zinc-binding dehydrogenase n=1 Tax=Paenibacillus methanolicus TaxID=582686 RepID=UPI0011E89042